MSASEAPGVDPSCIQRACTTCHRALTPHDSHGSETHQGWHFGNTSIDVLVVMAPCTMFAKACDPSVATTDASSCKRRRGADAGSSVDTAPPAMRVASSAKGRLVLRRPRKVTAEDVRQGKLARVLADLVVSKCNISRMGCAARTHSYATDCRCSEISHFVSDALQRTLSMHGIDHTCIHMISCRNRHKLA